MDFDQTWRTLPTALRTNTGCQSLGLKDTASVFHNNKHSTVPSRFTVLHLLICSTFLYFSLSTYDTATSHKLSVLLQ